MIDLKKENKNSTAMLLVICGHLPAGGTEERERKRGEVFHCSCLNSLKRSYLRQGALLHPSVVLNHIYITWKRHSDMMNIRI